MRIIIYMTLPYFCQFSVTSAYSVLEIGSFSFHSDQSCRLGFAHLGMQLMERIALRSLWFSRFMYLYSCNLMSRAFYVFRCMNASDGKNSVEIFGVQVLSELQSWLIFLHVVCQHRQSDNTLKCLGRG